MIKWLKTNLKYYIRKLIKWSNKSSIFDIFLVYRNMCLGESNTILLPFAWIFIYNLILCLWSLGLIYSSIYIAILFQIPLIIFFILMCVDIDYIFNYQRV